MVARDEDGVLNLIDILASRLSGALTVDMASDGWTPEAQEGVRDYLVRLRRSFVEAGHC